MLTGRYVARTICAIRAVHLLAVLIKGVGPPNIVLLQCMTHHSGNICAWPARSGLLLLLVPKSSLLLWRDPLSFSITLLFKAMQGVSRMCIARLWLHSRLHFGASGSHLEANR